ncbi:hypothetical protein [Fictibacillus macauensis]|nr:hypothetical protein [Fictibacillus macauensis]
MKWSPNSKQLSQSIPKRQVAIAEGTTKKPDESRKPEYELTFLNPN